MHDWIVGEAERSLSAPLLGQAVAAAEAHEPLITARMTYRMTRLVASVVVLSFLPSSVASVEVGKDAAGLLQPEGAGKFNAPLASTMLVRRDPHIFNGTDHER